MSADPPVSCPVCGVAWPKRPPRCFCHHNFETGDPAEAITRLARDRRQAARVVASGAVLIATLPLTLILVPSLLVAVLVCGAQLSVSLSLGWRGIAEYTAAAKRISAAQALRQLPEARVVR